MAKPEIKPISLAKLIIIKHHVPKNDPNEAKQLILTIKPAWKNEGLVINELIGGYVNVLFCVHLATDKEQEDAFVIRIFAEEEHDLEIQNFQTAHNIGVSPEMVAIFGNGVIYRFVPGRTLDFADLSESHIISKQMKLLAKLHSCDPENMQFYDQTGQPCIYKKIYQSECITETINTVRDELPDLCDIPSLKGLVGKKALFAEWEKIVVQLEGRNMPMTLNHLDFHMKNLIHNDKLTLIDYPSMAFAYEAYDLGYIFAGFHFFKALGRIHEGQQDFGDDLRLSYCRYYLQHKMALSNQEPSGVDEKQIEAFKADCDATQALAAFSSLCTVMAKHGTGELKFDTRLICQVNAECYLQKKQFLFR